VLARNFSKTFNLNRTMQISLEEHLTQSFDKFLQEHDEKLPSELGYSCVLTSGDVVVGEDGIET
jgi:hypothetical protein